MPYFSHPQKSFLFYPLLLILWEWFYLGTQENNVLVFLTCTHFACSNILSSIVLGRILNWTWHHLMFESQIGCFFFFFPRNNWNLSPCHQNLEKGRKSSRNKPCRKWRQQMACSPSFWDWVPFSCSSSLELGERGCKKPPLSWKVIWEPPQVQVLPTFPISQVCLFFSYQMPSHIAFLPSSNNRQPAIILILWSVFADQC